MPPGRGKGRGTRTTVTRGSGSTQGSRPGPIEGISWNDLHQVYKAREPSGLFPVRSVYKSETLQRYFASFKDLH